MGAALATVAIFKLLAGPIDALGRLPPAAYQQTFFTREIPLRAIHLLRDRASTALLVAGAALLAMAFLADAILIRSAGRHRLRRLFAGWEKLEDGAALRWLVIAVTGISAYALSTYDHNAYFDRAHIADRVSLVVLWAFIAWRPIFTLPFALAASAVVAQFDIPLRGYSWTEMELLSRIPILLAAFWIVRAFTREKSIDAFVFLWCCLIAVTMWSSGWGKLRIGWITYPHVDLLLLGAYANGWLGFADENTVTRVSQFVATFRIPLMLGTLVVECGALFLLWRRWSLLGFLGLAIAFHVSAFALSGIFFWKWILMDVAFLAFLLRGQRLDRLKMFSPARFALALALILGNKVWAAATNLTWFDTPLTYSIRVEGVDSTGGVHALPAGFFRPYAETFVLTTFPYLSPDPQLTRPMGVTLDRGLAHALVKARTPQDIFALEREFAKSRYDSVLSNRFDEFMSRFLRTENRSRGHSSRGLGFLGAPRHLWTFPLDADWDGHPAIAQVRVDEVTTFYDGKALAEIRRRPLRTIDVSTGIGTPAK